MVARVEILASRVGVTALTNTSKLTNGPLELDLMEHHAVLAGNKIELQAKEFKLLKYLLEHADQVVTRSLLFEALWNYNFDPQTNVIDVHIARLRKKLDLPNLPNLIETVRGSGYRMRKSDD
ncbi:response regulator [Vibrio astriarenae]|nr:response regulator [Vibrio sp. C7]